jgi:hypothetical protein
MNSNLSIEAKYPGNADLQAFFHRQEEMPAHRRLWAAARRMVGADSMKAYTVCIFVPQLPNP